jgi:hypothetical protein
MAKYWTRRRDPTYKESMDLFENGGGFGFISWFTSLVRFYLTLLVVPTFIDHFLYLTSRGKLAGKKGQGDETQVEKNRTWL